LPQPAGRIRSTRTSKIEPTAYAARFMKITPPPGGASPCPAPAATAVRMLKL
jgi:hypothetical protein